MEQDDYTVYDRARLILGRAAVPRGEVSLEPVSHLHHGTEARGRRGARTCLPLAYPLAYNSQNSIRMFRIFRLFLLRESETLLSFVFVTRAFWPIRF
jgi:hypothetical protein